MKNTLCFAIPLIATNSYSQHSLNLNAVPEGLGIKSNFFASNLICGAGYGNSLAPDIVPKRNLKEMPCISPRTEHFGFRNLTQS